MHIHPDNLACEACALKGSDEIPLFHLKSSAASAGNKRPSPREGWIDRGEKVDPKKSLAMLKSSLMNQLPPSHAKGKGRLMEEKYTDRADKRRRMYGIDTPGLPTAGGASVSSVEMEPREPLSAPPQRLTEANVGHGLLKKMGWAEGMSLGADEGHIVDPVELKTTVGRAGLGSRQRR